MSVRVKIDYPRNGIKKIPTGIQVYHTSLQMKVRKFSYSREHTSLEGVSTSKDSREREGIEGEKWEEERV